MIDGSPAKQRSAVRKWLFLLSLTALLAILFFLGWIPRMIEEKKIEALASEEPLPKVTIMQVKPNKKAMELTLPSSAQSWHITPIWARVNGYLLRYLVDIGDAVKEGELIAEIDTPETDQELAHAKAGLHNSIVERDIAKITSDRWQRLWNKNAEAVSKQEVDQYSANLQSAESIVSANEKNVSRLTFQQQFKYIYAPFDGIITKRLIDIGSLIYGSVNGKPQELFQIAQSHTIRFFVDVPQTYFTQIKEGIEARVDVVQLPGHVFKGSVSRYAKALDPASRTLLTEVDVENKENLLYPGVYGRVTFLFVPDTLNFLIPRTALIIRTGDPRVAIVDEDHTVHLKEVQIGRDFGNHMEITLGLKENEWIVTHPSDRIREGVKVAIHTDEDH